MNKIYWRNKKAYTLGLIRRKGGVVQLERLVAVDSEAAFSGEALNSAAIGLNVSSETDAAPASPFSRRITLSLVERRAAQPGDAQEEAPPRKPKNAAACWVLAREGRGGLCFKLNFRPKITN